MTDTHGERQSWPLTRAAAQFLQRLRRLYVRFAGAPRGVHAVPFTPEGKIVLVKLTYAAGWRVPGGGVKRDEKLEDAARRELTEEIGMIECASIELLPELAPEHGEATGSLFIARDVIYQPKRSLEIDAVAEFDVTELPADLPRRTRRWLDHVARSL